MSEPDAKKSAGEEPDGPDQGQPLLLILTRAQQQERAEIEERDRRAQEADARFRQERDAALRARAAHERRIRMAVNCLFVTIAIIVIYWLGTR